VGLTEDSALQLLEAAARNHEHTGHGSIHLALQGFHFVLSERFLFQLATLLPHFQRVVDLTLMDMAATMDDNFASWWTDENEDLLVEALERNTSLRAFTFQVFTFQVGHGNTTPVLSKTNLERVQEFFASKSRISTKFRPPPNIANKNNKKVFYL
jgi:hypothetical protein